VVPAERQTALEALADLGDVVLLPAQRRQVEVVGHHVAVADQARLGVAPDHTADHHAAGDVADLGRAEDLADRGLAGRVLRVPRRRRLACMAARPRDARRSAICRAIRSSSTTMKFCPAPGTAVSPRTIAGRDGSASSMLSPYSSIIARTRPYAGPATTD